MSALESIERDKRHQEYIRKSSHFLARVCIWAGGGGLGVCVCVHVCICVLQFHVVREGAVTQSPALSPLTSIPETLVSLRDLRHGKPALASPPHLVDDT